MSKAVQNIPYDEALGIETPRIWTAERDMEMWDQLQG